jgi:hypothetical protein
LEKVEKKIEGMAKEKEREKVSRVPRLTWWSTFIFSLLHQVQFILEIIYYSYTSENLSAANDTLD